MGELEDANQAVDEREKDGGGDTQPPASTEDTTSDAPSVIEEGEGTSSNARPSTSRGSIGPDVLHLQQRIGVAGTGKFDLATETVVIEIQRTHELPETGIVDPATWRVIEGDDLAS